VLDILSKPCVRYGPINIWPAQHDWLRRYFVFERATYALEEIVAIQKTSNFNGLSQKTSTVQQTVQRVLSGKPTF